MVEDRPAQAPIHEDPAMWRDVNDMRRELSALRRALHKVVAGPTSSQQATSGTAHVTINAGGMGIWICVTCCIAMLVGLMIGCFWISSQASAQRERMDKMERDVRDLNDYLSAIYVAAPQLKPKGQEDRKKSE